MNLELREGSLLKIKLFLRNLKLEIFYGQAQKFKERSEKDSLSIPDSSLLGNPNPYDIEAFISGADKLESIEPS